MFDNLKETIAAAESIISDVKWNKVSADQLVQYWTDKRDEFKAENPDEDDSYYLSNINEANIKVKMYNAIEKTITDFVRQALK